MKRFGILLVIALLSACTNQDNLYVEQPLKEIYSKANDAMTKENYEKAADLFDEVERQYPYSECASKAQLLSAYCAFKAQKFERAIASLDTFISLHPASPSIGYAYYLRALCYYTNLYPVLRDNENAYLASQALQEVIRRFPMTDYAQDARMKKDFISEHLASQDMSIAKNYLKERYYLAALKHFGDMVDKWPCSCLQPEVLYRIVECQYALGLQTGAQKTLRMLSHNFPKTEWESMAKALLSQPTTKCEQ